MATVGRKEGQNTNPRDERGWMIPRPGTQRRKIYDMLKAGASVKEICKSVPVDLPNFRVQKFQIVNADYVNQIALINKRRWRRKLAK